MIELRERLAAYAHTAWSGWMHYLFSKCTRTLGETPGALLIPAAYVERWHRQALTDYADLPESEKNSDRAEADKMLAIFYGVPSGEAWQAWLESTAPEPEPPEPEPPADWSDEGEWDR